MAESALELAVREAVGGSGQARRRVYELLAQESLYVDASHPAGQETGSVVLSTTTRGGKLEMAVFSNMDCALAYNPDAEAYRVHAPASWIFSEALRLGCAQVLLDSPQCVIESAEFAALAKGLVPGEPPKSVPVQTPIQPVSVPPPFVPSTPTPPPTEPPRFVPRATAPTPPPEDGPTIRAASGRVPGEAQFYFPGALRTRPQISAAYLFDLIMPGEAPMLCLGLKIDLPSAEWNAFIDSIDSLDEIPGLPNGVAVYPLNDEMLETAREVGISVLPTRA